MVGYNALNIDYVVYGSVGLLALAGIVAPLAGRRGAAIIASIAALYTAIVSILVGITVLKPYRLSIGGIVDGFSSLIVFGAALTSFMVLVGGYEIYSRWDWGESVPAIVSLALLGIVVLGLSNNMLLLYAGWILGAAATYIIIALAKDWVSAEAAVKYATLGGIASISLVLGLGYLFAATGSISFTSAMHIGGANIAALAAAALAITAAGYKMGAVPYHGWVPDVYGNVRPLLVAVAAPLAKAISILVLVRVLASIPSWSTVMVLLALLAVLTMTFGNIAATVAAKPQQTLAYSSIAQAGYLLAGLFALKMGGIAAQLAAIGLALHVLGYMFSKAASFLALDVSSATTWDEFKGFANRSPAAAAGFAMGLASLMGMPPSLGFWGKLYIVLALARTALPIAIVMAANFAIGAYYYAKLINTSFMQDKGGRERLSARAVAALLLGLLTFIVGLIPSIGVVAVNMLGLTP